MKLLSIIIPVFNEEGSIPGTLREIYVIIPVLRNLGINVEVIVVDDGSTDATATVVQQLAGEMVGLRLVRLTRNFGHQAALAAGYDSANGQAVVTMDGDGQHPPDLVVAMVRKWLEGWAVVGTSRREQRDLGWLKRKTSSTYYRFFSSTAPVDLKPGTSDFRLIDERVLQVVRNSKSHSMFYRGLVPWLGFPTTILEFEPRNRAADEPSFTFRKSLFLALAGLTTYSRIPLLTVLLSMAALMVVFLVYSAFVIFQRFVEDALVPGQASVLLLIMITAFIQLVTSAVILLYAYRTFIEVSHQPVYVVMDQNITSRNADLNR